MRVTQATVRRFRRARRAEELRKCGTAVNVIAEQLDITPRQVHRDLHDLPALAKELGGGAPSMSALDDTDCAGPADGGRAYDPDLEWSRDGLCREVDNEIFFPDKGGSTREGKAICRQCPVSLECLAYALRSDERFGIWGGLSERERRRLRTSLQGAS